MKFCTLTQFDTLDPSDHYNFENLKIQDGGRRHFEKSQDRHIPEMVLPITAKLGKVMHIVIVTMLTVKILLFYKSTIVAVAILIKELKTASLSDLHHPTPLILPNKTAHIIKKQNRQNALSVQKLAFTFTAGL